MTYSKDTRTITPGEVYVAIEGEHYDGHDFIPEAIEKGASGIVTEQDLTEQDLTEQDLDDRDVEVIRVDDSIGYLTEQATEKIARLDPDIAAITGSMGKTTTKAALRAVLKEAFDHVVVSAGNKNTPLGLSLLVLNTEITPETKLVLEMGARLPGDLKVLCRYFPPDVSIITNVRRVHIETFGSIEGVQREKSELVRALTPDGTACLNGDDERVMAMNEVNAGAAITYGLEGGCDVGPERLTARLPSLGEPAQYTALAAMSAGRAFGLSDEQINAGLEQMEPEKGRLRRLRGRSGSVLIDDSYNASPEAVRAALGVLDEQAEEQRDEHGQTRRVAFLGDMLELGETEVEQHTEILSEALDAVDVLHAVGALMARGAEALPPGKRERVTLHETSSALADALRLGGAVYEPQRGDVILVKGSQGPRMERVSEALLHEDLDPADVLPRQSQSWKELSD
jgi:UDP-N-acetylmuramoyl-tripeptide--D-alanyl-D-alanine ligase